MALVVQHGIQRILLIYVKEEKMQYSLEQKDEIQKRIERSAKFQRAFSGVDGEFALSEIDINANYRSNAFDPDPYVSAYKAGQRSMAVFIHTILDQDIKKAVDILEKGKERNEV